MGPTHRFGQWSQAAGSDSTKCEKREEGRAGERTTLCCKIKATRARWVSYNEQLAAIGPDKFELCVCVYEGERTIGACVQSWPMCKDTTGHPIWKALKLL